MAATAGIVDAAAPTSSTSVELADTPRRKP
jgi:hypothetical protein